MQNTNEGSKNGIDYDSNGKLISFYTQSDELTRKISYKNIFKRIWNILLQEKIKETNV